jgi:hypothetical protein
VVNQKFKKLPGLLKKGNIKMKCFVKQPKISNEKTFSGLTDSHGRSGHDVV